LLCRKRSKKENKRERDKTRVADSVQKIGYLTNKQKTTKSILLYEKKRYSITISRLRAVNINMNAKMSYSPKKKRLNIRIALNTKTNQEKIRK
jgi:predicted DNA binding CopG/RHH family protein